MVKCWVRLVSLICVSFVGGTDAKTDGPCKPMGGRLYDCVKLTECSSFSDLREPLESETVKMLIKLHCGFDKTTPKVCCPGEFQCGISKNIESLAEGTTATLGEYPWMALLSYKIGNKKLFQCGGTLINEKYVLTAAHCISPDLLGVRIGEHDISTKKDCIQLLDKEYCSEKVQDIRIESAITHEDYSNINYENDIGLLRLKTAVNLTRGNAGIICLPILPDLRDLNLTGMNVTLAGWGVTAQVRKSNQLQKVTIPVIDNEMCKKDFDYEELYDETEYLSPQKMCAGEEHKDLCQGDSGGPLMQIRNYEDRPAAVQFGIVSFGKNEKCGDGKLGVYTRVTEYVDWILQNIQP